MFPQQAHSVLMLNELSPPENKATMQRNSSVASVTSLDMISSLQTLLSIFFLVGLYLLGRRLEVTQGLTMTAVALCCAGIALTDWRHSSSFVSVKPATVHSKKITYGSFIRLDTM